MAKAKKLQSGNWRAQVYDYTDIEKKRHYESFTANTKKEAEYMAADFLRDKANRSHPQNYTLTKAIDEYIKNSDALLSPTTIQGYRTIQKFGFQNIMDVQIKKIKTELLQDSVNQESKRKKAKCSRSPQTISAKTVINEYGLITAVLSRYYPTLDCSVRLPSRQNKIKELLQPEIIFNVVKNTDIELPVLLAMWLSFSMSEIRGLTKSKSIRDGYIIINQVIVDIKGKPVIKAQAKAYTRTRKHKIPLYIQELINNTNPNEDFLVTKSGPAISKQFTRLLEKNNIPHMSFHDLRHINASIMAMLHIPDKYAMERGGWKTDSVMKKVYTHTFSQEREQVDAMIDNYFTQNMQHEMQHDTK